MSALFCTCQHQMKHREHQNTRDINFRRMMDEEVFIILPQGAREKKDPVPSSLMDFFNKNLKLQSYLELRYFIRTSSPPRCRIEVKQ